MAMTRKHPFPPSKEWLTVAQAADILCKTPSRVYQMIDEDKFPKCSGAMAGNVILLKAEAVKEIRARELGEAIEYCGK